MLDPCAKSRLWSCACTISVRAHINLHEMKTNSCVESSNSGI